MQRTPQHLIAYRGKLDPAGCSLTGRVLARPPFPDPGENDSCWDNLRNAYRRFDSERVPGVRMVASFRGHRAVGISDEVGDSGPIDAHVRQLGLIASEEIGEVAREVVRDQARPDLKAAAQP